MTPRTNATLATVAHLAVLGIAGPILLGLWLGWIGLSIGMVFVLGLGLILLAIGAWLFWPLAWFEESRVAGLYELDLPERAMRRSTRTDWLRAGHTALLQITDPRNWRAVASFFLSSLLGLALFGLIQLGISGLAATISIARGGEGTFALSLLPLSGPAGAAVGLVLVAVAIGGGYGLTRAHRAITISLLTPSRQDELTAQIQSTQQQRTEAVRAADVERTRIERDLHDGVQPRLVSVGMTLGMARAKLDSDPAAAAQLIDEAHASTKTAITELRQLARGIHPAVLTDRGLDAALSALAARSPVPVQLDVSLAGRCGTEAEAAVYFAVAESLTNVAKHSGAQVARVTIRTRPGNVVWARIEDDGAGNARLVPGGGLDGVANRIRSAGGQFTLTSPPAGPTTIEVSVPCAS